MSIALSFFANWSGRARLNPWPQPFPPKVSTSVSTSRPVLVCRSTVADTCAAIKPRAMSTVPSASRARPIRTLRVLRVVEGHPSRGSAGRMVISGRMADVCAELDRLAAFEAAHRVAT